MHITVSATYHLLRLDSFLSSLLPAESRRHWQQRIEQGEVFVNGTAGKKGQLVRQGMSITIIKKSPPQPNAIILPPLEPLYEDEQIIAVNKPAGFPCHPLAQGRSDNVLASIQLLRPETAITDISREEPEYARIRREGGLLHRLDNSTSGVLVCAKNLSAYRLLRDRMQGKDGYCSKQYLAIVHGYISEKISNISLSITHGHRRHSGRMYCVDGSSPLASRYRGQPRRAHTAILSRHFLPEHNLSLCLLEIKRGQRHQIRCHLAAVGHPVLGDSIYGDDGVVDGNSGDGKKALGLQLHHWRLRMSYPVTEKYLSIHAKIPDRMLAFYPDADNWLLNICALSRCR